jgi:integral membrane sensor domain MASE1
MSPFVFQRGETLTLALDAVSGDPASVTAISAQLKAVPSGRTSVPAGAPVAATFAIVTRAAGEFPPGWTLIISAATCSTLIPGTYLADARLEVAGGVIITEAVAVRIRASVSA